MFASRVQMWSARACMRVCVGCTVVWIQGCHVLDQSHAAACPPTPRQIDDDSVFPAQLGMPFPPNFSEVVHTIFKRLFRVYAHIYHSHFKQVGFLCVGGGACTRQGGGVRETQGGTWGQRAGSC